MREYDHQRLQDALRATGVGVWSVNVRDDMQLWMEGCVELLGLPGAATVDLEHLSESLHVDDRDRIEKIIRKAFAHHTRLEADGRVLWPDGSSHWLRIRGCIHRNGSGQVVRVEGVLQDITESKRLETQLRERERELSGLIGHLPGAVYRCQNDMHWSVNFVSEGIRPMTGYSPEDLQQGRITFSQMTHPDDREEVRNAVEAALTSREPYHMTYRIRTKSGAEQWIWEHGTGVWSASGDLLFLEGIVFDITRHKRAEENNARLENRLRQAQKMEALGTLAGGIAHDFNNVLAAISGNASLAIADLPPRSPALTSINEIKRSAARAADLVRQILAFSRQQRAERKPVDLQVVIPEATRLLRATLPARIEIRCTFAPNVPMVLADTTQIHQVIMNLGVNAAHAMGEQPGVLELQLDTAALPMHTTSDFEGLPAGRYVRLRVRDTGSGMDAQTIDRIFDPFFTTKPAGQGTGLGLSVVHGIVRSYGGGIAIDSTPGKGTTFCLLFPVATDVHAPASAHALPVLHGHGQHILYVDDEEALTYLAQRFLERLGYRVTARTDPGEALETFRAQPSQFDCVVTDLSMPGMSGADLAQELIRIKSDIPIILTSGHVRPEDVQTARRIGIRDVVRKPSSIDELARVLDGVLHEQYAMRSKSGTAGTS